MVTVTQSKIGHLYTWRTQGVRDAVDGLTASRNVEDGKRSSRPATTSSGLRNLGKFHARKRERKSGARNALAALSVMATSRAPYRFLPSNNFSYFICRSYELYKLLHSSCLRCLKSVAGVTSVNNSSLVSCVPMVHNVGVCIRPEYARYAHVNACQRAEKPNKKLFPWSKIKQIPNIFGGAPPQCLPSDCGEQRSSILKGKITVNPKSQEGGSKITSVAVSGIVNAVWENLSDLSQEELDRYEEIALSLISGKGADSVPSHA